MLDKFKYKIYEIRIPGNVYINPKNYVLCETVPEIWKNKFLFWMAAILNVVKIWWHNVNLRLLPSTFLNSMV